MQNSALVLFSGGQDSTTCLYWAQKRFSSVRALTIDYGQNHAIELESARRIAVLAGVSHEILALPLFSGMSTLTAGAEAVPDATSDVFSGEALPSTFVPGRNIVFLSIAASKAFAYGSDFIICGVSQTDYSGYPDCRAEFIESMEMSISRGLERNIRILCPLMHLDKTETVRLAQDLPGCMEALALSTTCYRGMRPACGTCNSCVLRSKGFEGAGIEDPCLSVEFSPLLDGF